MLNISSATKNFDLESSQSLRIRRSNLAPISIFLWIAIGCSLLFSQAWAQRAKVECGVDIFFKEALFKELKGKRVGLVTNHTGVDGRLKTTISLFLEQAPLLELVALFAPEHGIHGHAYAWDFVEDKKGFGGIPVYSLHGATRRPTAKMLAGVDVIVYDIQDIGCRSYTYTTTLFYVMEEAAKYQIPVIVFDRPNPINGLIVDGPMLQEKWRSFIGYVNVPFCHGMTIGELASFFNEKYRVGCQLRVVPMKGWKRWMSYRDTGLHWVPTSPQIPEPDSPVFYATTGILGELGLLNIGVGYTLPFKVVGAPWIQAVKFAEELNAQKLPGVVFLPFYHRPFYGLYKGQDCQGVLIVVTNQRQYRPVLVQHMLIGLLKTLYPKEVEKQINALDKNKKNLFCKATGNEEMYQILSKEKYAAWKLILFQKEEREQFSKERKRYLLYENGT